MSNQETESDDSDSSWGSVNSMDRAVMAGANNAEDFGFEPPNPIEISIRSAMDAENEPQYEYDVERARVIHERLNREGNPHLRPRYVSQNNHLIPKPSTD